MKFGIRKNVITQKSAQICCLLLSALLFITATGCKRNPTAVDNSSSAPTRTNSETSDVTPPPSEETVAEPGLVVTSPKKTSVTVTEPAFTFTGTCDPTQPLLFNGEQLQPDAAGNFSRAVTLNLGANTFVLEHKGEKKTYTVNYRYVVMKACDPGTKARSYESGATVTATVNARAGASCSAHSTGRPLSLSAP